MYRLRIKWSEELQFHVDVGEHNRWRILRRTLPRSFRRSSRYPENVNILEDQLRQDVERMMPFLSREFGPQDVLRCMPVLAALELWPGSEILRWPTDAHDDPSKPPVIY